MVTNLPPDFVLRAAALEPGSRATANLSPFTTLALATAEQMSGGRTSSNVRTALGTVTAEGLVADVVRGGTVSTVSGAVVVDGTHGMLVANAVSGDLAVRNHTGDLKANTVSGSVTASGAFAQISVTTVSGAITLDAARAAGIGVQTVSGDTTVRLPADLGASVSARSVSGRVVIDGEARAGDGPLSGSVDVVTGDGTCRLRDRKSVV